MKNHVIVDLVTSGAVNLIDSLPVNLGKIDLVIKTVDRIRAEYSLIDAGYKKIFSQYAKGQKTITPQSEEYSAFIIDKDGYSEVERDISFAPLFTSTELQQLGISISPMQYRALLAAGLISVDAAI